MNGQDILLALSHVEEKYVDEAEHGRFRRGQWIRFAAAAACLCVILTASRLTRSGLQPDGEVTEGIPEMMPENGADAMEAVEGGGHYAAGANAPLLLTVERWTENGFVGVVLNPMDDLTAGTRVEVKPMDGVRWDLEENVTQVSVHDYVYDPDENILYAGWIGKDD